MAANDLYCVDVETDEEEDQTGGFGRIQIDVEHTDATTTTEVPGVANESPNKRAANTVRKAKPQLKSREMQLIDEEPASTSPTSPVKSTPRTTISSPPSTVPSNPSTYSADFSPRDQAKKGRKGLMNTRQRTQAVTPFYRAFVSYVGRQQQVEELTNANALNKIRWIHPESKLREVHTWACLVAILYNLVCAPIRFGWDIETNTVWLVFDIVTDMLLWADIVFTFVAPAGKSNEKLLQAPLKKRVMTYFTNGFILHLVGTFPLEYLLPAGHNWRLTRLIYLRQVAALQNNRRLSSLNPSIYRILVFAVVLVFFIHIGACSWIKVARTAAPVIPVQVLDEDNNTVVYPLANSGPANYIRAVFFAMVYLVGYNAGIPTKLSLPQVMFGLGIVVTGASIFATVIGTVGVILRQLDANQQFFRDKVEQVNSFMEYSKIPDDLRTDVRHYYKHMWESRRGLEQMDALRDIPQSLHREIMVFLHKDFVQQVDLFKNCSPLSIVDICCMLDYVAVLPGYLVMKKGEIGREMYFILRGTVQVITEPDENGEHSVIATLSEGQFFGEVALVSQDARRTASIMAASSVELYKLAKSDLDLIMEQYPDAKQAIMEVAGIRWPQSMLNGPPQMDDEEDDDDADDEGEVLDGSEVKEVVDGVIDVDFEGNDEEIQSPGANNAKEKEPVESEESSKE
eukprot:TRINITY_DN66494_c2_g1_i1.p1 TRINITY_DN66494_c2_g1~~TRINITY_DN66494_c2_g1_i1.p1  ORF type:complete len:683 (+),score=46.74 TRINITY_DN66494_c2_g1_i1:69-2117(+)